MYAVIVASLSLRSLAGSLQGCLIIYKYCMSDAPDYNDYTTKIFKLSHGAAEPQCFDTVVWAAGRASGL